MTGLGNAWRYFRQRGLIATVRIIIDRHVYRSQQYVVTCNLLDGAPGSDRIGGVVVRLATPSDFSRLGELEQYGRGATTQRPYVEALPRLGPANFLPGTPACLEGSARPMDDTSAGDCGARE